MKFFQKELPHIPTTASSKDSTYLNLTFFYLPDSGATSADTVFLGNLNLNHTGMQVSRATTAVMAKGSCGETFFQRMPPIKGAGKEIRPRLVLNRPNAVPRRWAGTALLIRDWYAGAMRPIPVPATANATK